MLTQKQINRLIDKNKMIYIVDVDDTLLDFMTFKPIQEMVDHINKKHIEGNYIYIHTARPKKLKEITEKQLKKHGIKYNELVFDKIKAHITIDDSSVNSIDYLKNPDGYDRLYKKVGNWINHVVRNRGM